MNLRQLECFFAVADSLHFGNAAKALHLSQTSVSEAVKTLEASLGAPLFERTTRRVRLTPFGADFLARVRPPWDQLKAEYHAMRQRDPANSDEIILLHTPELGHLVLPELSKHSAGEDVGLMWRSVTAHTHTQIDRIGDRSGDVGLCWAASVRPPIVATTLARCPFVAIFPEGDPLASVAQVQLSSLRGRRIVVSARQVNNFIDARLQALLLQNGLGGAYLDEVDGYDEVALRVAARGHVGLHPASIANLNRVPGVEFRLLAEPALTLDVCAIYDQRAAERLAPLLALLGSVTSAAMSDVVTNLDRDQSAGVETGAPLTNR